MTLLGMNMNKNSAGEVVTTLHVADEFPDYYKNLEAGRTCIGQKVESIYVGAYDCSELKVGMSIDILYGKAVSTKNGVYQPIKAIQILSK